MALKHEELMKVFAVFKYANRVADKLWQIEP